MVSSRIEKEKKDETAILLMESHGQSVPKQEDEPKKEKTKESKMVSIWNEKEKKKDETHQQNLTIDRFQS